MHRCRRYRLCEQDRKAVELIVGQQAFQRSSIAPPTIVPEPLSILRAGFDAAMRDALYLADAD